MGRTGRADDKTGPMGEKDAQLLLSYVNALLDDPEHAELRVD